MNGTEQSEAIHHDPSNRRVVVASLDASTIATGVAMLAGMDPALAALAERNGTPPLWAREPGFATIVHFVLEQQVSLASSDAAFRRLGETIGGVRPEPFLALDDGELRTIGFSRQKAGYVRGIAHGVLDGLIDFDAIEGMSAAAATEYLVAIRGIGPWTAACYLLFCLRRPDVWPPGDRALQVAMGRLDGDTEAPGVEATNRRAESWRPLRSVAARMLWHEYLGGRDGDRFVDGRR